MAESAELTFANITDRTRMDRLQGEILAFVSDFEERGYHNMDIARELAAAAFRRADREKSSLVRESFYQHLRDVCSRYLTSTNALYRELGERIYKQGN